MYALKITDFSAKSLETIFTKHIDPLAKATTDSWRGYTSIAKKYTIKQILSNKGLNFPALHTMILKSIGIILGLVTSILTDIMMNFVL